VAAPASDDEAPVVQLAAAPGRVEEEPTQVRLGAPPVEEDTQIRLEAPPMICAR